ncbi:hypothetical protein PoB_004410800 [Plakobranchus ocellatus]|uniref:Uncharacterized protein n=1 Tax=Plakobranchus ocellatus TaxID=259542 RepID=A0AAV4BDG2_9GAST|nr:hypothetical protein PoB_004410800 [Plakobranchus ocellatus]
MYRKFMIAKNICLPLNFTSPRGRQGCLEAWRRGQRFQTYPISAELEEKGYGKIPPQRPMCSIRFRFYFQIPGANGTAPRGLCLVDRSGQVSYSRENHHTR